MPLSEQQHTQVYSGNSMAELTDTEAIVTKASNSIIEIGILCYPGSQTSAILGLTDLFSVTNTLKDDTVDQSSRQLRVSHWTPQADQVLCTFDSQPDNRHRLTAVIIPPSLVNPDDASETCLATTQWLRQHHEQQTILCSVCAGAFKLADTGLLNGRTITTHWCFSEQFSNHYPNTRLNLQKMIIDDGDIVTAGGLMAWTDLALTLIERFFGSSLMLKTARFLLIDPAGREQQFYRHFQPNFNHGDESVLAVQNHIRNTGQLDLSLVEMANIACLEKRTFQRRFRSATSYTPVEYCQQLKVEAAREKLELGNRNIEQIAWEANYQDPAAFRKIFKRIVGLTPSEYRQRFNSLS